MRTVSAFQACLSIDIDKHITLGWSLCISLAPLLYSTEGVRLRMFLDQHPSDILDSGLLPEMCPVAIPNWFLAQ